MEKVVLIRDYAVDQRLCGPDRVNGKVLTLRARLLRRAGLMIPLKRARRTFCVHRWCYWFLPLDI